MDLFVVINMRGNEPSGFMPTSCIRWCAHPTPRSRQECINRYSSTGDQLLNWSFVLKLVFLH